MDDYSLMSTEQNYLLVRLMDDYCLMFREQNYLLVRLMDRLLLNVQRAELSVS